MERIENFYLKLIRVFLVIFATIALIYALINLITSLSDIIDEPELEQVEPPGWSDLRYEILPIKKPSQEDDETIDNIPSARIVDNNVLFESKLKLVIQNLQKLFSEDQITIFESSLNLEYLVAFRDNIPDLYLENFTEGMVFLSLDLSEDNLLKRIEDPLRKVSLVTDSLDLYKITFFERLAYIENSNFQAIQNSQQINTEGYSNIIFTAYALGLFIIFLLYVLILKVEYNLRKIAPAISSKEK